MTMIDVVCLGEALVDFLPLSRGGRVRDVPLWQPCLGGAPANVTVGLARLGAKAALVGVVGADEFGWFLKEGLAREGVHVSRLRQTQEGRTGLGFVSLTRGGERSFTFYRNQAAETFFDAKDIEAARRLLAGARALHVGTNSLVTKAARAAVLAAMQAAHRAGQLTSTDPNLRLHLWPDPAPLRRLLDALVRTCAVVKLSHDETRFVAGTASPERALDWLEARGVVLGVVTLGARGAVLRFRGETRKVPARRVRVVDTTGAGDGFTAGLLYAVSRQYRSRFELERGDIDALEAHARFACLVGSHVVTKLGAVAGLPTLRQLGNEVSAQSAKVAVTRIRKRNWSLMMNRRPVRSTR
jgi:fructokinase